MNTYFEIGSLRNNLEVLRGCFLQILIDKKDETERVLSGVLCYREDRDIYFINEGTMEDMDAKNVNMNKVRRITFKGINYFPKGTVLNENEIIAVTRN